MSCGRHHHLWSRRRAMLISIGRGLNTTHPGARSKENPHTPAYSICRLGDGEGGMLRPVALRSNAPSVRRT